MSESNFHHASLDRQLRRRLEHERCGHNPPPALRLEAIAERFGISVDEVRAKLVELNPGRRDA